MASVSYECNVIYHCVSQPGIIQETRQIPPRFTRIELTIDVDLKFVRHDRITGNFITVTRTNPFSSHETIRFDLNLLKNHDEVHQVLAPTFIRLGINTASTSYDTIIREIVERGLRIADWTFNMGYSCKVLHLHSEIRALVVEPEISQEILMTRALAESASEFERNNYGMVAAKESSVKEMLKRVRVEDGDEEEEDCMICLEELKVGLDAFRMPCSHTFHGDCIEKWLKQSHYCPICRFEMPTN